MAAGYVRLWPAGQLAALNANYAIQSCLGPHCVAFGTDGGNACYGFNFAQNTLFCQPLGDLDPAREATVATQFAPWLLGMALQTAPLQNRHTAQIATIAATAPDPWAVNQVEAELQNPIGHGFGAFVGQTLLAFVFYRSLGQSCELALTATHPAYRRLGVGQFLLRNSLALLKTLGEANCILDVRAGNAAALALYGKLGFGRPTHRPSLYNHPPEDGLTLQLKL